MAETFSSGADVDFDETSTLTDTLPTTDRCVFCGNSLNNGQAVVSQTVKGIHGIQKTSQRRGDDIQVVVGQTVHKKCRDEYCNANVITRDLKRKRDQYESDPETPSVSLRSSRPKFDFGTDCLLCGVLAKEDRRKGVIVYPVRTFDCQEKLLQTCSERGPNDMWAETVRTRIQYARDLHAADAVYHHQCNVNFRTKKNIPLIFRTINEKNAESAPTSKPGRPVDEDRQDAFLHVANYLEVNDDEQITVADLCEKMREYLKGKDPYTEKHLRTKLKDHFGDDIIITSIQGKTNVVTFRITAEKILKKFSESEQEKDAHDEKLRIIKTAAKLLLADMKEMTTSKNHYPSPTEISDLNANLSYLPSSLVLFLKTLLHEKKKPDIKIAAIGQALTQAARPKVLLAPLQIGLSVELHHLFGSKYVIEHMNRLGFCSSYAEVKRFEQCAASSQGLSLYGTIPDSRIQFVADNVDHNIRTLDGSGTFHGMGIIAAATPGTKQHKCIPRDVSVTASSVSAAAKIPISYFDPSTIRLSMKYGDLQDFRTKEDRRKLDLVWKISWPLRSPRPGWSGTMQTVSDGNFPGQSSFTFLPMIDIDPSNLSCVYSTLQFVSTLARENNITPVVTFDQPLWWKAMVIIDSQPPGSPLRSIVLRLGGFHTQMSFLACMGRLMAGSGLQQVMEVVFASNAVTHMLSGKAISRAVRGHFLVDAVLNALILSATFSFPLKIHSSEETAEARETQSKATSIANTDDVQDPSMRASLESALSLFDLILQKKISVEDVEQSSELDRVEELLLHMKESLRQQRTRRLWLQYMDMVDILRRFLTAERTGNWQLHLHCLQEMLPYLAAAGHNLYTKSIFLYLQEMQQLKQRHPSVYHEFLHGYHVLRRSDRFWAGLSTDLVIEQVLMRSVKSAGGLTRGRGMGDSQRTQWLLSMPARASMNNAMQEVSDMEYTTSDQHAESGETRQGKDDKAMKSLLSFLLLRNPFAGDDALRNICTGATADSTVNVDTAKAVGDLIIKSMTGSVKEFKFKRKDQAVTMDIKTSAKVDGECIQVNPQLLFQRLVTAANAQSHEFDLPSAFEFELSSPPASLFEPSGLLRESHKSGLADAIAKVLKEEPILPEEEEEDTEGQFVLDGGSLLHKIPWRKQDTFKDICKAYADHIKRRYKSPIVVFDGYDNDPTTKDIAHLRRASGAIGPVVKFTEGMVLSSRKDHFLSNPENKQAFVKMLGNVLKSDGCTVHHAAGDADTLIVSTALKSSATCKTTVVGEDTDLLVLLCFHTELEAQPVYLRSDRQTGSKRRIWHIQSLKQNLGQEVCELLPFIHAVNGCDTTSRLCGIGKGLPLKKVTSDSTFKQQGQIFCSKHQNQETIIAAGQKALVCLYNGRSGESLDTLRYNHFCEKVATRATSVDVQSLPPTSSAAKYHSLRVYLQVQEWIDLKSDLKAEEWGWQQSSSNRLEPQTTDLPPAPEALLRVIRCNCTRDCQSRRCTCRKFGLECSVACGGCRGLTCSNSPSFEEADCDLPDISDSVSHTDSLRVDKN